MESAADDRHRMGAEDIHYQACAELREIVTTYEWIGMAGREVVDPGLVLDQVIDARTILQGPFHRGHESRQRESLGLPGAQPLLEQREHRVRNEVAAPKVGLFPDP